MPQAFGFDRDDVKRIQRSVKSTEATSLTGNRNGGPAQAISAVVVKIVAAGTGGGFYTGNVITFPTSDVTGSSTLGDSDIGVVGPSALIENLTEKGRATHDLTTPALSSADTYIGVLRRINSDGTWVVAIAATPLWEDCEADGSSSGE